MKKNVITTKLIYYIISALILIFMICYPIFIHQKVVNQDLNINSPNKNLESGFLKIWHIDDFEGGSGNRTNFLQKTAQEFESQNKGWFVVVQSLSKEQAFNAVQNGEMPDLISFSHYSGVMFQDILQDYQGDITVREDLLECGKLNGKVKAIPWYLSGYCLIGNTLNEKMNDTFSPQTMFSYDIDKKNHTPSVAVGLANFNFALLATLKNKAQVGAPFNLIKDFDKTTTFEAYNDFCNKNSASVLLGTARDFYRIKNKMNLGVMNECRFFPLGSFSDLVGFIGVCKNEKNNAKKAVNFVEFLTSKTTQNTLKNIGLFSTTYSEIYKEDEHYNSFEKVLQRNLKSINIFMQKNEKERLWKESINATFGNQDSLNFVRKYL